MSEKWEFAMQAIEDAHVLEIDGFHIYSLRPGAQPEVGPMTRECRTNSQLGKELKSSETMGSPVGIWRFKPTI